MMPPFDSIFRDGTNQQDRLLRALQEAYVQLDERTIEDWIRFAQRYASELKFFDENNQEAGDWKNFLQGSPEEMSAFIENPKSFEDHPDKLALYSRPHVVLFLLFLKQLQESQQRINAIKERQLDYYYYDVLGLKKKAAIADQVHLLIELAENIPELEIAAGLPLDVGTDSEGNALTYNTDHRVLINQAILSQVSALHIQKDEDRESLFIANDATQLLVSQALVTDEKAQRWRTFGEPDHPNMNYGDLGLAITSPILRLAEGKRIITIAFLASSTIPANFNKSLFDIYMSTEEDARWLVPDDAISLEGLAFEITLETFHPAITNLPADHRLTPFLPTPSPIVEFVFKPEVVQTSIEDENQDILPSYEILRLLSLSQVNIIVDVKGLQNITLQNDFAELDPNNPFEPFGNAPRPNAKLSLFHPELCGKKLSTIKFSFNWQDKPNLSEYYQYYSSLLEIEDIEEGSFDINLQLVDRKSTLLNPITIPLFTLPSDHIINAQGLLPYIRKPDIAIGSQVVTSERFFQLKLGAQDFFHQDYQEVLFRQANIIRAVSTFRQGFSSDSSSSYRLFPPLLHSLQKIISMNS